MNSYQAHQTVLMSETLEALALSEGLSVFEGTAGEGGLTSEIAKTISPTGTLVVTDLDENSIHHAREKVMGMNCRIVFTLSNFSEIKKVIHDAGLSVVNRIVLDLGLSSVQIENSGRGFSFSRDESLLMTFRSNPDVNDLTAEVIVNNWSEMSLADIFWGFGGERKSRVIAKAIVIARQIAPIKSSLELAKIVETAVGGRKGKIHPATRVFQAIRIAVNDELGSLRKILRDGWEVLSGGGRVAVISFHELEDREVKKFFKSKVEASEGELVNKKVTSPSNTEIRNNPRSRSAKLRAITKK